MEKDFSWASSAKKYMDLYHKALDKVRTDSVQGREVSDQQQA